MSYYKIRNSNANHGNNNNGNGMTTEGNNSIQNHSFGNHNNPLQEPHHQNRKMSTASSFDVIRSTRSSDSFSSMFSAISPLPNSNRNSSNNPFTAHFEAINRLPLDHWLKVQKIPMEKEEEEENEQIMEDEFEEGINEGGGNDSMVSGLKALLSNLQLMQEQTGEQLNRMMEQLEKMIMNDNGQQKRIHPQQKMQQMQFIHPQQHLQFAFQPPKLTTTTTTIIDENENDEMDQNGNDGEEEEKKSVEKLPSIPLKLPSDAAHWLKKYPPPKQNRPMNEQAEDVSCWESVLGWKRILEKIHASGEHVWLAPSSRSIKN